MPGPYGTDIREPYHITGQQYGPDQTLNLEDLGLPGLSLTDQQYLAGLSQYYNPGDPAAAANAAASICALVGCSVPPSPSGRLLMTVLKPSAAISCRSAGWI